MSHHLLPARPYSLRIALVSATLITLAACGGTSATSKPPAATTAPPAAAITPSAAPASALASSSTTFTTDTFAVPFSLSLAGGWTVMVEVHSVVDLRGPDTGGGPLNSQDAGVQDIASTTVAGAAKGDPYMPWPKDLYAWLQSRPEFKPEPPKTITVGGRPATQIDADVSVPSGTRIELICSEDSSCWLLDHNDRWRFVEVKDDDGSGVVWITNGIPAPGFDAYAEALDQLLATVEYR